MCPETYSGDRDCIENFRFRSPMGSKFVTVSPYTYKNHSPAKLVGIPSGWRILRFSACSIVLM